MTGLNYASISQTLKDHALKGSPSDIEVIMEALNEADLPVTRIVDFCLSQVTNPLGIDRIAHYLFHGTQIQRNYATLFFARRNDWNMVNEAYAAGSIDKIQAFSR